MPVLTDARIEINSADKSAQARSVTLNYGAEEVEDTAFGDSTRSQEGGLNTWDGQIEFYADETSGGNTVDVFALIGTTTTIAIRPTSSAISGTNPEYSGTALITSMEPVSGSVGDSQINTVNFVNAGDLSRATT